MFQYVWLNLCIVLPCLDIAMDSFVMDIGLNATGKVHSQQDW